jgi:Ran GTPase-activating protein (RanGAP) involved in mRNA processing and transport
MSERNIISSTFLDFCTKLRDDDPTVLPSADMPFRIRCGLSETEHIGLSDALLESRAVKRLELEVLGFTERSAKAIGKYLRSSKHLVSVSFKDGWVPTHLLDDFAELRRRQPLVLSILLRALRESTSLKELTIKYIDLGRASLDLQDLLIHTQSLQKLDLSAGLNPEETAHVQLGLTMNSTLVDLTLYRGGPGTQTVTPILKSLHNHPFLQSLRLEECAEEPTGIDTLLLSDKSKITQVIINLVGDSYWDGPARLTPTGTWQALGRKTQLTKLDMSHCHLTRYCMRQLRHVLRKNQNLQSLGLAQNNIGSACLAEMAPALYRKDVSIKELDLSWNDLDDMESASLIRDLARCNKSMTKLNLTGNLFGRTPGAVRCIADGLGSNTTLLEVVLSNNALGDDGLSMLVRGLWPRNTVLQKLMLEDNRIAATGVHALVDRMVLENNVSFITDLNLGGNPIRSDGASFLANALESNSLPHLARLSLCNCSIGDDGFASLVSALERNHTLLLLDLRRDNFSPRAYLALAGSLPRIKALHEIGLYYSNNLASVMPSILEGLRENTSLVQVTFDGCTPLHFPPSRTDTTRCAGRRMQEMQYLGHRNRFMPLLREPAYDSPPLGLWPHALAKVATQQDVLFYVLRSKPTLTWRP